MAVSLYSLGVQGLLVAKQSLDAVGNNIANVNTEGYSRQSTVQVTAGGQQTGNGFVGIGTRINDVIRSFDEFAFKDLQGNTSNLSYNQYFLDSVTRVDQVISDSDTSITNVLAQYFSALNSVADNPNSLETRNNLIEVSKNMTSNFTRLYDQLDLQYRSLNNEVDNIAQEMTALATNLAEVNKQIQMVWGDGSSQLPNDLLDQRNRLVLEISKYTDVSTVELDNGSINLFIGTGQPLVLGQIALKVESIVGRTDNAKLELALSSNGTIQRLRGDLMGGKIQAVYDFRNDVLDKAFNQLGQTAIGIGFTGNEQQKLGLDLNMQVGTNFFNDVNSQNAMIKRVLASNDGLGEASLGVQIENASLLPPDNFELTVLSYAAGPPETVQFQLTNIEDGTQITLPAAGAQDLTVSRNIDVAQYGFSLNVDSISATDPLQVGKRFELRPTRLGAQVFATQISDTALIAAAGNQVLITDGVTNTGVSKSRITQITNPNDVNYPSPEDVTTNPVTAAKGLRIEVTEAPLGTFTYQVLDANTGAPIEEPVGTPLTGLAFTIPQQTISHAGFDIEITIEDTAALDNYSFTIDYNETGVGSNENARVMANFQTDKTLNKGRSTFQDNYALMTSDIGTVTSSAQVRVQSSEVLFEQASNRLTSVAGVNLDEEAANLLKYQTAYNAAARVVSIADELMETLLAATR
ncbi:MAG: flagellar hook-associated protein FlgK [Gammaproteobacteria bacterium]|nr:MAG: flagellar hook-associated protein FlgK [Gammaproteobacteria bacterium]